MEIKATTIVKTNITLIRSRKNYCI